MRHFEFRGPPLAGLISLSGVDRQLPVVKLLLWPRHGQAATGQFQVLDDVLEHHGRRDSRLIREAVKPFFRAALDDVAERHWVYQ